MNRHLAGLSMLALCAGCASGDLSAPIGEHPRSPGAPGGELPQSDPNRAPVALPDTVFVAANTTLILTAPGILLNDTDADGDPLLAFPEGVDWDRTSTDMAPEDRQWNLNNGTVFGWDTRGGFKYTPGADFTGTDELLYRAFEVPADGLASASARVVIIVQ